MLQFWSYVLGSLVFKYLQQMNSADSFSVFQLYFLALDFAYQINFVAMKEVQAIIHWQAVIQGVAEESDMTEHTCTHNVAAT